MHWYRIVVMFVGTILNGVIMQVENKDLAFCLQSIFNATTLFLIINFLEKTA